MQNFVISYLTAWLAVLLLGNSDGEIGITKLEFRLLGYVLLDYITSVGYSGCKG